MKVTCGTLPNESPTVVLSKKAKLAATGMHTSVYAQPNTTKKIG
jgi:hypothetical protein